MPDPTPDSSPVAHPGTRPGETPLQGFYRDECGRLTNRLRELPDCVERTRALGMMPKLEELAVVAAGKVAR